MTLKLFFFFYQNSLLPCSCYKEKGKSELRNFCVRDIWLTFSRGFIYWGSVSWNCLSFKFCIQCCLTEGLPSSNMNT